MNMLYLTIIICLVSFYNNTRMDNVRMMYLHTEGVNHIATLIFCIIFILGLLFILITECSTK